MMEEQQAKLQEEAMEAKQSREALYDRLVNTRTEARAEFESGLQGQLDAMRERNAAEIKQLQRAATEVQQRENDSLARERDQALSKLLEAEAALKESRRAHDSLQADSRATQLERDARDAEVHADLRMKSFEIDRLQMLFEESQQTVQKSKVATERAQQRFQVLQTQFYELKATSEQTIAGLEASLREAKDSLRMYADLEQELDDVVMHAAQTEDPEATLVS